MKELKKAQKELEKEQNKQLNIIFPACAIVWWKEYGWRKLRIGRRFVTSQEVWDECGEYGNEKSILEMLEEETGVNIQLSGCEDWHDLPYFCKAKWDGKPLTEPEQAYMHWQQKKWVAILILACVCISLYRDEHWGTERLSRFVSQVDALRIELGERPDLFLQRLREETGLNVDEIFAEGVTIVE